MSEVWKYSRATGADLLVMLALADFSNDQGESYPSLKTIAQKARLSVRGVCKILDRCQAAGELRRDRSRGGKNRRTRYFINPLNSEQHSENDIQRIAYSEPDDTQTVNGGSHALNRHRTVNKRERASNDAEPNGSRSSFHSEKRKQSAAPADPRVKTFLEWFAKEFEKRFGSPYAIAWAKDGKHVKELPQKLETLKELAIQFFESDDPWIRDEGGFTVSVFISQINKLASRSSHTNGATIAPKIQKTDEAADCYLLEDGTRINRGTYRRMYG